MNVTKSILSNRVSVTFCNICAFKLPFHISLGWNWVGNFVVHYSILRYGGAVVFNTIYSGKRDMRKRENRKNWDWKMTDIIPNLWYIKGKEKPFKFSFLKYGYEL